MGQSTLATLDSGAGAPHLATLLHCNNGITLQRCDMKAWLFAGAAMLVAANTLVPTAQAAGPRASSENNWPGMMDANGGPPAAAHSATHYVWQEGFDRGGKWHGHWVLAR